MSSHHVSRSRLHDIALRRLRSMDVTAAYSADGQTIQGRLEDPQVFNDTPLSNPVTGNPIRRVEFVVEGHDRIRGYAPPALRHLPPVPFYDASDQTVLARRLADAMTARAGEVQQVASQLRQKGLEPRIDGERLLVVLELELAGQGRLLLEGWSAQLQVRSLIPVGGSAPQPLTGIEIDLGHFDDRTDLEIHLGDRLSRGQAWAGTGASDTSRVTAAATTSDALTLGRLVQRFGEEAVLEGDTLVRELLVDGKPVRLEARHLGQRRFAGRLVTSYGVAWEESFDLGRFPGVEAFVLGLLSNVQAELPPAQAETEAPAAAPPPAAPEAPTAAPPPPAPRPAAPPPPPAPVPVPDGALLPVAGEIWVMDLQVQAESPQQVRYVAVNAQGEPLGQPKVLPRPVFERTFAGHGTSRRLLIQVVAVDGTHVVYRPLDAARQPSGAARKLDGGAFLATFVAEAAAY